jgi:hypothetical protein
MMGDTSEGNMRNALIRNEKVTDCIDLSNDDGNHNHNNDNTSNKPLNGVVVIVPRNDTAALLPPLPTPRMPAPPPKTFAHLRPVHQSRIRSSSAGDSRAPNMTTTMMTKPFLSSQYRYQQQQHHRHPTFDQHRYQQRKENNSHYRRLETIYPSQLCIPTDFDTDGSVSSLDNDDDSQHDATIDVDDDVAVDDDIVVDGIEGIVEAAISLSHAITDTGRRGVSNDVTNIHAATIGSRRPTAKSCSLSSMQARRSRSTGAILLGPTNLSRFAANSPGKTHSSSRGDSIPSLPTSHHRYYPSSIGGGGGSSSTSTTSVFLPGSDDRFQAMTTPRNRRKHPHTTKQQQPQLSPYYPSSCCTNNLSPPPSTTKRISSSTISTAATTTTTGTISSSVRSFHSKSKMVATIKTAAATTSAGVLIPSLPSILSSVSASSSAAASSSSMSNPNHPSTLTTIPIQAPLVQAGNNNNDEDDDHHHPPRQEYDPEPQQIRKETRWRSSESSTDALQKDCQLVMAAYQMVSSHRRQSRDADDNNNNSAKSISIRSSCSSNGMVG